MRKSISEIRDELADREAIRDCIIRYARGIDRIDEEELDSVYWDNATDDHIFFCGDASRFKELILVNGMLLLLQRPTLIESILGGRVKWEAAVEEFLRLESPVRGTWRIAARDSELGGVPIPKGKMVFLNFGAANRDANQFPDPEELDVERKNAITSLTFGYGIHSCLGIRLARKEMLIAFQHLFSRLKNIRLAPGMNDFGDIFADSVMIRGVKALHLTFDRP